MTLIVGPMVQFVYDDALATLAIELGQAVTKRASHVEPVGAGWTADMGPIGGPVLGPFKLHADAIAAELAWIRERMKKGRLHERPNDYP